MKKNYLFLATCCLLLTTTGCQKKKTVDASVESTTIASLDTTTQTGNEENDAARVDTFKVERVVIEEEGEPNLPASFKYTIDFPQKGPKTLVTNIRKTIFEVLGDSVFQKGLTLEGLHQVGQNYVNKATEEMRQILEEYKTRENIEYANSGKIVIEEDNDNYVTYFIDSYLYEGGAHGMPQRFYLTFSKKSGQLLDWNDIFLESARDTLSTQVQKAIVQQYYKGQHKWDEFFKFALPQQAPAFSSKGIVFYYQSYEIDAYAAGMPNCVLPYANLKALMTPEAQALIP